jgi:hypothetical protein
VEVEEREQDVLAVEGCRVRREVDAPEVSAVRVRPAAVDPGSDDEAGGNAGVLALERFALLLIAVVGCTPAPAGSTYQIGGQALARPTCPVEPASPLPGQCAPRPVADAVMVDVAGHEVIHATTGADGQWTASIPAGTYAINPQPVQGLLGTAQSVSVSVAAGSVPAAIAITYDTGIR